MTGLLSRLGTGIQKFGDHVAGLQGDPLYNLGVGLLAAGGPRRGPKIGFGQGLLEASQYANRQQLQANQLNAQRQALQQKQQQQQAINRIGQIQQRGLLSPMAGAQALMGNIPQSIARPGLLQNATNQMAAAQNNHVSGLLAQANPQAFTQAAIAQQFAPPQGPQTSSRFADYLALGGDPNDMQAYNQFNNPSDPEEDARLALLSAQLSEQIQQNQTRQQEAETTRATLEAGIESGINDMVKLFDVNNKLDDTFLQSGLGSSGGRRTLSGLYEAGLNLIGGDTSGVESLNENFDLFKKISTSFANNSMARLSGAGSNFRLQATMDANANDAAAPGANRFVIASNLQELLTQARANRITLPQEVVDRARDIINSVFAPPPPAGFVED